MNSEILKRHSPELLLRQIDKEMAERRLAEFIRRGWRTVETSTYKHNWHIDAIGDHLEAAARREIKRIIINLPPRHMKSLQCGVFFPSWVWAQDPGEGNAIRPGTWMGPGVKFLSVAHKGELAERDARLSKTVMQHPWYQARWGDRVRFNRDESASGRYRNSAMGARYTGSFKGGLLGEGGDILIVDDPHPTMGMSDSERQAALSWFDETLKLRLNDQKDGVIIVIMQRLHERDLTGHILATETGWDHLCLPAQYEKAHPHPVKSSLGFKDPRSEGQLLWEERFDDSAITGMALSEYTRAGQLQQRPAPREGGMFKKWWFTIRGAAPKGGRVVRRWDFAATEKQQGNDPDWTVGLKMRKCHEGYYWIEDVVRIRGTPHEVERLMRSTAESDGHGVTQWIPQDPGAAGKMVAAQVVRRLAPYTTRIALEGQMGSKIDRADPFAAQAEAGNVFLVRGEWNEAFLDETILFPNASHDDQVDAASGAYLALEGHSPMQILDAIA